MLSPLGRLLATTLTLLVVVSCGSAPTAPSASSSDNPSRSTAQPAEAPSTERSDAGVRRHHATCGRLRHQVTATYRVRREPAATGARMWLELTLTNRSASRLTGETGGVAIVTRPVDHDAAAIDWGGSSADFIAVPPRSTSTRGIYTINGEKLQTRADARIGLLGVYTYLAKGRLECSFPARMRAPAGLVLHHPRGSWFLTVETGGRLRERGFAQLPSTR